MLKTVFDSLEGCRQGEYLHAPLEGDHPPRREAAAVARTIDLVMNRDFGIAGTQKIGMKGMARALRVHRPGGRHQRLGQDLAAKHTLERFAR